MCLKFHLPILIVAKNPALKYFITVGQRELVHKGPFIKYVRRNIEIFDPPSLCVRQRTIENAPENNRCTQEMNRKITLPPSIPAYVLNEWPLSIRIYYHNTCSARKATRRTQKMAALYSLHSTLDFGSSIVKNRMYLRANIHTKTADNTS